MIIGEHAFPNPCSLHQVQQDHAVLKTRMKVGLADGKEMLDCTFRPLLLRGETAGQVSPRVLQLNSSSVWVYSFPARKFSTFKVRLHTCFVSITNVYSRWLRAVRALISSSSLA